MMYLCNKIITFLRFFTSFCIIGIMDKTDLKNRRERLGLSQTEFGEIIGKTQNTVSRYESGSMPIPKWLSIVVEHLEAKRAAELTQKIS